MGKDDFSIEPALINEKQLVDFMYKMLHKYMRINIIDNGTEYTVKIKWNSKVIDESFIRYREDNDY